MNRIFVSASLAFLLVLSAPVLAEDGEIAEPTREELKSVDASLDVVRAVCSSTLDALLSELRTRYPDIVARRSGGRSQKNDYRNYQWISVRFGDREYMLAAHHGNLDVKTGNPHTQFGRIQFWRGIDHHNGPQNEAGPHTRDAGGWRFRSDKQWEKMPRLHLWSPEYSSAHVVDLFLDFMRSGTTGAH